MKKIALFLLGLVLVGGVAYAGIGTLEDSSYEGETGAINCSTDLDCATSGNITTISVEAALNPSTSVTSPILASTYYITAPYYARVAVSGAQAMVGSGAPAGSVIVRGGPASKNCGIGGDGTVVYVCVSNGTNWIPV